VLCLIETSLFEAEKKHINNGSNNVLICIFQAKLFLPYTQVFNGSRSMHRCIKLFVELSGLCTTDLQLILCGYFPFLWFPNIQ